MLLAFDRAPTSQCCFDSDGRLRVSDARISRAGISRYRGDEIPGWRLLGLDGGREYRMLRHPDELAKAARTFRGVPLLSRHAELGEPHRPELVIGTVGSDAHFDGEYLRAGVCVWAAPAIRAIQDESKRQLSAGYRYQPPDMTPGMFRGQRFDGVMRDLEAGHVALCAAGKCGPDCAIKLDTEDIDDGQRYAAAQDRGC